MLKSKLKLDISCLTPRQQRRNFLKDLNNIRNRSVNFNTSQVENDIVSESNVQDSIEPQQQNNIREIDVDDSNVINTDVLKDDSISICSRISANESNLSSSNSDGDSFIETEISEEIRRWAIENCLSQFAISSLLKILIKYGHDLPADARTLLRTPKQVNNIIEMEPGNYYHAGLGERLKKSIRTHYSEASCPSQININVNVDGLPLTKSSGSQLWPILASIVADFYTEPFIVGVYHGSKKPKCSNNFMQYFKNDCVEILQSGIIEYNKKITVKINAFICDTPARSFIKGIVGHNGHFGYGNCIQEGDYIEHRVTFQEINATLRSDESFKLKQQEEHHKFTSNLEELDIGMVTQFPLDYMHLVLLGVMKKLLQFWVKGKLGIRFVPVLLERISTFLLSLSIPKEFGRKPRELDQVDRFKAIELKTIVIIYWFCNILQKII